MKMIHETKDYDSFKHLPGQRGIVESHVREIMKSIEENGWICDPIRVTESMEVFDGQHRLEALRRLDMPVEYLVIDNLTTANAVRIINNTQKKWQMLDYSKSYSDTGVDSYYLINDLMEKYNVDIYTVLKASGKGSSSGDPKTNWQIKNGEMIFTLENYRDADSKLPLYLQYCSLFSKHKGHKKAKTAAYFFLIAKGYDYKMIETAELNNGDSSKRFFTAEDALEYIERICNYKKQQQNRIYPVEEFKKYKRTHDIG